MFLVKPKTRKAILKEMKRLIIKHGSEVIVGLVTGLVTSYLAEKKEHSGKGKKKHDKKNKDKE